MINRNKFEHMTDLIRKRAVKFVKDGDYKYDAYRWENPRLNLEEQAAVVTECVLSHKKAIELVLIDL